MIRGPQRGSAMRWCDERKAPFREASAGGTRQFERIRRGVLVAPGVAVN